MSDTTTITISKKNYERLSRVGMYGESMNTIVSKVLNVYEAKKPITKKNGGGAVAS